jgi:hypothetical protein
MKRIARCHCDSLRAILTREPERVYVCHCEACQRRTGAVMHAGAYCKKANVQTEGAEPRLRTAHTTRSRGAVPFLSNLRVLGLLGGGSFARLLRNCGWMLCQPELPSTHLLGLRGVDGGLGVASSKRAGTLSTASLVGLGPFDALGRHLIYRASPCIGRSVVVFASGVGGFVWPRAPVGPMCLQRRVLAQGRQGKDGAKPLGRSGWNASRNVNAISCESS